jgi:hypothetical protein
MPDLMVEFVFQLYSVLSSNYFNHLAGPKSIFVLIREFDIFYATLKLSSDFDQALLVGDANKLRPARL